MLIAGMTFKNELVTFNISDCPVRINNDVVILKNIENSPLIQNHSIRRRSSEDPYLEEFAYVFEAGFKFCGYVIYKDGFKLYNPTTKQVSELEEQMTYMYNTNSKQNKILSEISDPIKFKFGDEEYLFKHIIGCTEEGLLVYSHKGPKLLKLKSESEVTLA